MPSRVQTETQGDSLMREAARMGGPLPYLPMGLGMKAPAKDNLTARERRVKLPKGFMGLPPTSGDLLQSLARLFLAQRKK